MTIFQFISSVGTCISTIQVVLLNQFLVGLSSTDLREQMKNLLKREAKPEEDGNVFAYTYTKSDEHFRLQQEAFDLFAGRCVKCKPFISNCVMSF